MLVYWVRSRFGFGLPHESAHRAAPGVDAGRVAGDHPSILPSAGDLDVVGAGPACGELDGESDAAAVRGPASFESGRGAGGGEPAVDLVDGQADDRLGRRRRRRGVQSADRGGAAADQPPDVGPVACGFVFERRTVTTTSSSPDRSTSAQRRAATSLRRRRRETAARRSPRRLGRGALRSPRARGRCRCVVVGSRRRGRRRTLRR